MIKLLMISISIVFLLGNKGCDNEEGRVKEISEKYFNSRIYKSDDSKYYYIIRDQGITMNKIGFGGGSPGITSSQELIKLCGRATLQEGRWLHCHGGTYQHTNYQVPGDYRE